MTVPSWSFNEKLKQHNKDLQKELAERHGPVIRITGPGGFPLYAHRHISHARPKADGNGLVLELLNSTGVLVDPGLPTCPIPEISSCELHIGNKDRFRFCDVFELQSGEHEFPGPVASNDHRQPEDPQVGDVWYQQFGPALEFPDYDVHDLHNIDPDDFFDNVTFDYSLGIVCGPRYLPASFLFGRFFNRFFNRFFKIDVRFFKIELARNPFEEEESTEEP